MKRVLIYSQDTLEAGDLRCMRALARRLLQSSGRLELRVISGTQALNGVTDGQEWAGISNITLPSVRQARSVLTSTAHPLLTLGAALQLRMQVIRATISDFAPDLILVDRMPFGMYDELGKVLAALKKARAAVKCVLLLRDMIGSPKRTAQQWRDRGYFDAIAEHFEQVLVLGEQEIFDMRREYSMPEKVACKLQYCGYVAAPPGRSQRDRVRRALGLQGSEPLVLVLAGEGLEGETLVKTYINGLSAMSAKEQPRSHIVCGENMSETARLALACAAHALPQVSIQHLSRDAMSLMAAADVVVTDAGYQTTCQLLTLRRRAVVIPSVLQSQEQAVRAEHLAVHGLLRYVRTDELQPQSLLAAVRGEILATKSEIQVASRPAPHGLEYASTALLDLINLEVDSGPGELPTTAAATLDSRFDDVQQLSLRIPTESGVLALPKAQNVH